MDYMDKTIATDIGFSGDVDDDTFSQSYIAEISALIKLDDTVKGIGYGGGLVELFRDKGFFYWEKLDDPTWRSNGG